MLNWIKLGRKTYYTLILWFSFDCFLVLVKQKRFKDIDEIIREKFWVGFKYENLKSPKENYEYIYNLIK